MIQLIPAQTAAYRVLRYALNAGDLLLLRSVSGRGRTTVLKKLHEETGGAFVNSKDFIEGSGGRHPLALPETFHDCVAAALRDNKNVYVDDADLIHDATSSCTFYPRGKYIEAALLELSERAVREGKSWCCRLTGLSHRASPRVVSRPISAGTQTKTTQLC